MIFKYRPLWLDQHTEICFNTDSRQASSVNAHFCKCLSFLKRQCGEMQHRQIFNKVVVLWPDVKRLISGLLRRQVRARLRWFFHIKWVRPFFTLIMQLKRFPLLILKAQYYCQLILHRLIQQYYAPFISLTELMKTYL